MKQKVILITGAAGFIGSNLAKNILQKDSEWKYRRPQFSGTDFSEMGTGNCCESGGTGRCALFDHEPGCLYREQYPWIL